MGPGLSPSPPPLHVNREGDCTLSGRMRTRTHLVAELLSFSKDVHRA